MTESTSEFGMAPPTVDVRSRQLTSTAGVGRSREHTTPYNDGKPVHTLPLRVGENGSRVTVRHFLPTDAPAIAYHCNNPRLGVNMRDLFPSPYTLKDAEEWIAMNLDRAGPRWQVPLSYNHDESSAPENKEKTPLNFLVCLDDQVVGGVGLVFGSDIGRRTAELGYWLGEAWWGKGIMSAVVEWMQVWAFETFPQLLRLEAGVFAWNARSCRVLEQCGWVEEGRHRCAVWKQGRAVDLRVWARVRDGVEGATETPDVG